MAGFDPIDVLEFAMLPVDMQDMSTFISRRTLANEFQASPNPNPDPDPNCNPNPNRNPNPNPIANPNPNPTLKNCSNPNPNPDSSAWLTLVSGYE